MSHTVAVLNQKGGVGKTTVTLGLASAAWAADAKVLVVDLDAQANATYALGVDPSFGNLGVGDAMASGAAGAAANMIVESGWGPSVSVLPGGGDLTEREADPRNAAGRRRLAKALSGVTKGYDLVLIDCAPSLGLNTTNGLAAADGAIVVVEPSVFGLRGVSPVLDLIEEVWANDNKDLDLSGVILNRVPPVSNAAQDRISELKKMVGSKGVWTPHIPLRVLVNQAHHERSPIHSFGAKGAELASIFDSLYRRVMKSASN
ncbi:MAG: ParA family protein [Actinomycetota bacterium]